MEKKASEITIGTIIFIILGILVLVILIYGFSTGWSNLWERIIGISGGDENVQLIVQNCMIACETHSQYDYCTKIRTIKFKEGETLYTIKGTCDNLEKETIMSTTNKGKIRQVSDGINDEIKDAQGNVIGYNGEEDFILDLQGYIQKPLPPTELSCNIECPTP